jgi:hypothetical protein
MVTPEGGAGTKRLAGDTARAATSDEGQGAAPGGQCVEGGGGRADRLAADRSPMGWRLRHMRRRIALPQISDEAGRVESPAP